jgi:hypothetical protein
MDGSYQKPNLSLIWRGHDGGEYLESLAGVVPTGTMLVVAAAVRVGRHDLKPRLITSSRLMYAVCLLSAAHSGPGQRASSKLHEQTH